MKRGEALKEVARDLRRECISQVSKPRRVAFVKQFAFTNVPPDHGYASVAGLLHDVALGRTACGR